MYRKREFREMKDAVKTTTACFGLTSGWLECTVLVQGVACQQNNTNVNVRYSFEIIQDLMQGDVFTAEYFLCHGVLVLNFHMQYYIVYTVQCQHAMFLGCCIKVIYELNIKL